VSATLRDEFYKGHNGTVIEWLTRIPRATVESNPQLRLVALWMHGMSYQLDDALRLAGGLIDEPAADESVRTEAMAALGSAYAILDRHDEARHFVSACEASSPGPVARQVLTYLHATIACTSGEPECARRLLTRSEGDQVTAAVVQVWYDFLQAWSYLWEGRPAMAEQAVRWEHGRWDAQVGRRGSGTVILGSLLAGACWQQDLRDDARALLADRLDSVEQACGYGGLVQAYLTMARMAEFEGDEARALACLEALAAVGEVRGMVRVVAASLAERVRLHAARRRPAQAAVNLAQLSEVVDRSRMSELLAPLVYLEHEMAWAFSAVAADDSALAQAHVTRAKELATRLNRGYEAVQALALEALLAERAGASPETLLTEALSRAESGGLVRVFADTLPEVVELVSRHARGGLVGSASREFIDRVLAAAEPGARSGQESTPLARSALLTPKEYQVLRLLAGGLPNKRIAAELDLSADTVKWHVKKLLAKLNAGSRDHAVDRARMLGLLR
jgi:LuxR family maltose regulon positive regulatory protein